MECERKSSLCCIYQCAGRELCLYGDSVKAWSNRFCPGTIDGTYHCTTILGNMVVPGIDFSSGSCIDFRSFFYPRKNYSKTGTAESSLTTANSGNRDESAARADESP